MLRLTSSFTARALTECVLLALTMIVSTRPASAAVPPLMNYQGYLTDVSDQPVSGSHAMSFALYADSTGGTPLWSESYASVQVVAGVFNVLLGSVTPLQPSLFTGAVLWIQTEIEAVDIQPRRPLVTVAYSFNSQ
jgi:hypothetical protein